MFQVRYRKYGRYLPGTVISSRESFDWLYDEDIKLAAEAGLKAFRFSIAWPRVQPTGAGVADRAWLDLYERIIDTMLARDVEPWPTLFHWDIPATLSMDWRDRDLAYRFADYARIVAERLGDRVRNWILLNEPNTVAVMGYGMGLHAPGVSSAQAILAASHHQNLADCRIHPLCARACRQTRPNCSCRGHPDSRSAPRLLLHRKRNRPGN